MSRDLNALGFSPEILPSKSSLVMATTPLTTVTPSFLPRSLSRALSLSLSHSPPLSCRSSKPRLPRLSLDAILFAQPIRIPRRRTPRLAISLPPAPPPAAVPTTPLISSPAPTATTALPPRLTPRPRVLALVFVAAPALRALCALGQRLVQAFDEGGASGVGGGGAEFLSALEGFEGFGGGRVGGGAEALGAFLALGEFVVEGRGWDAGGEVGRCGCGFGLGGFFFGGGLVGGFGGFSGGFAGGFGSIGGFRGSRGSFGG